jgi:hypothetical protein
MIDHVDDGGFHLVGVDVLRVDPAQRLRRGDLGSMARRLDAVLPKAIGSRIRVESGGIEWPQL